MRLRKKAICRESQIKESGKERQTEKKNATRREIEREILARDREIIGEKEREESLRKKAICR